MCVIRVLKCRVLCDPEVAIREMGVAAIAVRLARRCNVSQAENDCFRESAHISQMRLCFMFVSLRSFLGL